MAPSARVQFFLFFGIALAGVVPTLLVPGSTVGDGVDAIGTQWFYWWIRHCIEQFQSPSFTDLFFYPYGKDVFAHTGNNFVDAALSVPLQWIFGPTLYSPIWTIVLQLGNVIAFRPLARYLFGDTFSAFAATLLFQINPFVIFEITAGRPTQAMLWFLPMVVLYLLRAAREPGWKNGAVMGVAMALAGWTYWFNTYFLLFLLLPLAAWELHASTDRWGVIRRWSVGVLVCLVLVAPGVVGMSGAVDAGRVPGIDHTEGGIFRAPEALSNNISPELHGLWLMERYFVPLFAQPAWGLPLLLVPFLRKLPFPGGRWPWIVGLVGLIVFAVGTFVRVGGVAMIMPHYMVLYRYLPFFDRLWFPYRMVAVAFIPAALLIGAMVAMTPRPRLALSALVVLGLAGQVTVGTWPFSHRYARAPGMVSALKEEGGAVIFLPMMIQHDGLAWQTEFQLPTFGGMGESASIFWPAAHKKRLADSFIQALQASVSTAKRPSPVAASHRALIEQQGFRWVIYRRSLVTPQHVRPEQAIASITALLGQPPVGVDGESVLWDLLGTYKPAPEWEATPRRLARHDWETYRATAYEKKLRALGRTGSAQDSAGTALQK